MTSFCSAKLREITFQTLFAIDVGNCAEEDLIAFFMHELAVSKKNVTEAFTKAHAVWERVEELDEKISSHSREYAFDRIQRVEKNILRLALFELLIEQTEKPALLIGEALRLMRKFSTKEGGAFVNAILDGILRDQPEKAMIADLGLVK